MKCYFSQEPVTFTVIDLLVVIAIIAILEAHPTSAQSTPPASPDTPTVMTYNLKFASTNTPNAWSVRGLTTYDRMAFVGRGRLS